MDQLVQGELQEEVERSLRSSESILCLNRSEWPRDYRKLTHFFHSQPGSITPVTYCLFLGYRQLSVKCYLACSKMRVPPPHLQGLGGAHAPMHCLPTIFSQTVTNGITCTQHARSAKSQLRNLQVAPQSLLHLRINILVFGSTNSQTYQNCVTGYVDKVQSKFISVISLLHCMYFIVKIHFKINKMYHNVHFKCHYFSGHSGQTVPLVCFVVSCIRPISQHYLLKN